MKNQYKHRKIFIFLIIVALIVILGVAVIAKLICPNKIIAQLYPIKGIDVSHHQNTIEWEKIPKQEIDFAFIKATEGSGHVDENFLLNWRGAKENNILAGAYHFFSFDSSGKSQAELFVNTVGILSGKLRPVVDVEFYADKEINQPKKESVQYELTEYLQLIEEEYSVKPIIYTTYKVYELYLKESFEQYPLWIRNVYFPPYDKKWEFWQYSDRGEMEGIGNKKIYVDLNVFQGNVQALQQFIVP